MKPVLYALAVMSMVVAPPLRKSNRKSSQIGQDGEPQNNFPGREIYARVSRSAQTDLCF